MHHSASERERLAAANAWDGGEQNDGSYKNWMHRMFALSRKWSLQIRLRLRAFA
jgi:hypothetical protein